MELFEGIRRDHREEGLSRACPGPSPQGPSAHRAPGAGRGAAATTGRAAQARPGDGPLDGHSSGPGWWPIARRRASSATPRGGSGSASSRSTTRRSPSRPSARPCASCARELESGIGQVTIVACHPPGEEAEVDFGEATIMLAGEPTMVHLFHLRLSRSGKGVTLAFLAEDQAAFLEGHAVAFERLGGVPTGRIRYDNLQGRGGEGAAGPWPDRDRPLHRPAHPLRLRLLLLRARAVGGPREGWRRGRGGPLPPTPSGARARGGQHGRVRRRCSPRPTGATSERRIDGRRETVGEAFEAERPHLRPAARRALRRGPAAAGQGRPQGPRLRPAALVLGARRPRRSARRRPTRRPAPRGPPRRPARGPPRAQPPQGQPDADPRPLPRGARAQARRPALVADAGPGPGVSGAFTSAHERFWRRARRKLGDAAGTRALIEVLLLHRRLPFVAVHAALDAVERIGSVDPALVAIEARRIADGAGHHRRSTADRCRAGRLVPAGAGPRRL